MSHQNYEIEQSSADMGTPLSQALFFQESVHRLCGTLDLGKALQSFFPFLQSQVPVRRLLLGRMRMDTLTSDSIAMCDQSGVHTTRTHIRSTPEQMRILNLSARADGNMSDELFVLEEEDLLARYFIASDPLGYAPFTPPFFFMRMRQGDKIFGSVTFACAREEMFSERDLNLLRMLRTPFLIALNNWVQYTELTELKEEIWQENLNLRKQLSGLSTVEVIGSGGGLRSVMEKVRLAAPVAVPVLITGETGTGKELIARAVHDLSPRGTKPFVAVNCGGIPPSLIDSELFGHIKGAFTGASTNHRGRFERAQRGTIFLDEIAELPMNVQARLLRVLQEHCIERVGGNEPVPVDFRLIAATNRDLRRMVQEGTFREDLYYRLHVVHIRIPPLRERKQDIPLLAEHLVKRSAVRFGVLPPPLAPGELGRLLDYAWPGNVRELQNLVEEALVLRPQGPLRFWTDEDIPPGAGVPLPSYDAYAGDYFRRLLAECGNRINGPGGAAERSGINANTLRSRLKKMGIPYHRGG